MEIKKYGRDHVFFDVNIPEETLKQMQRTSSKIIRDEKGNIIRYE